VLKQNDTYSSLPLQKNDVCFEQSGGDVKHKCDSMSIITHLKKENA